MTEKPEKSAAVKVAKRKEPSSEEVVLTTGVRARLVPVSASLIDEVVAEIQPPDVPVWTNPEKDREEPNPNDPEYLRKLADVERRKGVAAIDAMILFGVELLDGLPEDDGWLTKLKFLEKRGKLNLDDYDVDDEIDKAFLFKKFVAVSSDDLMTLSSLSGVSQEDVAKATDGFRGTEESGEDS